MVGETFILRVYHFWMSNKQILKYARFRPILSHFPLSTGQIFKLISPHENIIKFFQLKYISILHIKRHQKITQAKVFENFTSRQHALQWSGPAENQQGRAEESFFSCHLCFGRVFQEELVVGREQVQWWLLVKLLPSLLPPSHTFPLLWCLFR